MDTPTLITLASNGTANFDIVRHTNASSHTIRATNRLKEYLDKITGAEFSVITGTSTTAGIRVGPHKDFPELGYDSEFDVENPFHVDHYVLFSHNNGLDIIGQSEAGTHNGVWGFLNYLGYEHYFPEDIWEYIPDIPELSVEIGKHEAPDFIVREAPKSPAWSDDHATGGYSLEESLWVRWRARNRLVDNIGINQGHIWGSIINRNQDIFDANPHFVFAGKFRIHAVGEYEGQEISLIDVVLADAVAQFDPAQGGNPERTSISMDPTDGTSGWSQHSDETNEQWENEINFDPVTRAYGWVTVNNANNSDADGTYTKDDNTGLLTNENGWYFEYENETWILKDSSDVIQATGESGIRIHATSWSGNEVGISVDSEYAGYDGSWPSDKVVFLANLVAEEINNWSQQEGYGIKYVGYYGYAQHISPPNIPVHPRHVISFVGGFSTRAPQWVQQGAQYIGAYDRFNLIQSDRGQPPVRDGGLISRYKTTYDEYYSVGGRLIRSDTTDTWSMYGIAYFLALKKSWSLNHDVDEIVDTFIDRMFEDVAEIIKTHDGSDTPFEEQEGEGGYFNYINRRDEFPPRSRQDYIARIYRILQYAHQETSSSIVKERINYLTLYWHFIELFHIHHNAESDSAHQSLGENMSKHTYRMMLNQLSPVTQLYRHYIERSETQMQPTYQDHPEFQGRPIGRQVIHRPDLMTSIDPWSDNTEFTDEEVTQIRLDGIANFEPEEYPFEVKDFSKDLVPFPSHLVQTNDEKFGRLGRDRRGQYAYVYLEENQPVRLLCRVGVVRAIPSSLHIYLESEEEVLLEPVDSAEVPPDEEYHEVLLTSPYTGLHFLSWRVGSEWAHVYWPDQEITGSPESEVNGLWSRVNSRRWVNANRWTIGRAGSSLTFPWELRDPEGNLHATAPAQPPATPNKIETEGWDGLMEGTTITRYTGQRIVNEFSMEGVSYDWNIEYFFYVPKGTEVVGGIFPNDPAVNIEYPDGTTVEDWKDPEGSHIFGIDVPEGMDGDFWRVRVTNTSGDYSLLTVPTYVARSADEMLIPMEVYEADFTEQDPPNEGTAEFDLLVDVEAKSDKNIVYSNEVNKIAADPGTGFVDIQIQASIEAEGDSPALEHQEGFAEFETMAHLQSFGSSSVAYSNEISNKEQTLTISLYSVSSTEVVIQIENYFEDALTNDMYRSEIEGELGTIIGENINPAELFIDDTVESGKKYYYTLRVTR